MLRHDFFACMSEQGLAPTYADVIICSDHSEVLPADVSTASYFSRRVPLKIPIVSAAMDTVTEHPMAIAMAKLGGLGIIHRGLSAKAQAAEVARVKHHLHGLITKPICVHYEQTIGEVLAMRRRKNYRFHSFLVVDDEEKLVGVLTGNDFDFCLDHNREVVAVMSTSLLAAPEGTPLESAFDLMAHHRRKLLPIVTEEFKVVGLYTFADAKRIMCNESTSFNLDEHGQLRVGAAIGVGTEAVQRAAMLVQENVDVLVIDTAHGDTKTVTETLGQLKREFPAVDVVVGNITGTTSAQRLCDAGADGIKVGQGSGSICTTRPVSGVGIPQLTAIYHCAQAAEKCGVPLCADGGIRQTGDITIALAAGADSVMLGRLLAGTEETPGRTILHENRQWKVYRGMGSLKVLRNSRQARQRYQHSEAANAPLIPQGIEGRVPYKGKVARTVEQCEGGLRQGMGSVGAATIPDLHRKASFLRLSAAGQAESHPHDVVITEEAPNYQSR